MTEEEEAVYSLLAEVSKKFVALPFESPQSRLVDTSDFLSIIRQAQNMVLVRHTLREMGIPR